jgi:tetratricopeptide (TPR) repeat protein
LSVLACLTASALAAPAPLNFPEVAVNPASEDACFAAAQHADQDADQDVSPCHTLIQRVDLDPQTRAAAHNNRGLILSAMGLHADALGDFESAMELAPGLAHAQVNRANVMFMLKRYPEALKAYDELLTTTTQPHVVLFNRALVHRALGNVEAAGLDLAAARRLADGT